MPRTPKPSKTLRAPFNPDGSLQHFPARRWDREQQRWVDDCFREVEPWQATMTITGMHSGRSAKYTEWTDEQGRKFPMFVADVIDVIREAIITRGSVTGTWTVRKRGENYGIRYVPASLVRPHPHEGDEPVPPGADTHLGT